MKIYTTKDYSLFKLAKNRPISEIIVERLKKYDTLKPIVVDNDMNVLDG